MISKQEKMYGVKDLREEYKKECTKIGIINELGFIWKYLSQIEIVLFVFLLCVIGFIGNCCFKVDFLSFFNLEGAEWTMFVICFFVVFFALFILVLTIGEYCLEHRIMKVIFQKKHTKYRRKFFFHNIPDIGMLLKDEMIKNESLFFKKYFVQLSKEDLKTLYEMNEKYLERKENEITSKSNIDKFLIFLSIAITVMINSFLSFFYFENMTLENLYLFLSLVILVLILAYASFKFSVLFRNRAYHLSKRFKKRKISNGKISRVFGENHFQL